MKQKHQFFFKTENMDESGIDVEEKENDDDSVVSDFRGHTWTSICTTKKRLRT